MWARRLGVPHLWPSRVKVFFLAILTSVINFSVFQYLHNANVAYLNLSSPASEEIVCKLPREECASNPDPASCTVDLEDRRFWRGLNLTTPCPKLPDSLKGETCRNPWLPLRAVSGDLGSLHTVNVSVHPFRLWSILFLILTSLLTLSILIHDLALLEEDQRPFILSIPNMKYATPCLWDCLTCVRGRLRAPYMWSQNRCFLAVLVMLWSLLQAVAFMAVLYPFSLLVCIYAPVKMSRIMVFLSSILCILWSVVFMVTTALVDTQPYAVLWGLSESSVSCLCLCQFPLSRPVVLRVLVLGTGVCWHSINLTLRALKGLRRAQWANMFSVLYAVPVEAFPVVWERPEEAGGGPIRWRKDGEAVQSEPAFDPFCLMDEQPESAWTRAIIAPVPVKDDSRLTVWEPYLGTLDMEIGWCGFPRPVGGAWEKDCSDYESDKLNVTDVEPEPAQPELQISISNGSDGLNGQHGSQHGSQNGKQGQWSRKVKPRPPPMQHLQLDTEGGEGSEDDQLQALRDMEAPQSRTNSSSNMYHRRLSDAQGIFHTEDKRPPTPARLGSAGSSRQHSPTDQGAPNWATANIFGRRLSTPVGQAADTNILDGSNTEGPQGAETQERREAMAMSFASERGSGILLSRVRLSSVELSQFDKKPNAPPVWPAVLTSFLHCVSLGAALMTWLRVCEHVVSPYVEEKDVKDAVKVAAQTYYGRLLAVNAICELVTSQFVGVASDKHGRRPVQVAAQLGQVIDYLLAALCLPSFGYIGQLKEGAWFILFFSRGIAGLLGNYKVSLQSYTADISTVEECPTRMAYLGGALVTGMCAGSMLATAVGVSKISFRWSFLAATAINVGIIALVVVKWRDIAPRKDYTWREANPFASFHLLGTNRAMAMYSALVFLSSFSLNMFSSTLVSYCETFLNMDTPTFSALVMMWTLESAICLGIVQPALVREVGEIATLQLSFLCMIVFYVLFCLLTPENSAWVFVIMILFSMGSITYPLAVSLATRELPPELQGSLQGAVSVLETVAKIIAPLLASDVIIPAYSEPGQFYGMVYFVAGLLLVPSLWPCHELYKLTARMNPDRTVMLEEIGG